MPRCRRRAARAAARRAPAPPDSRRRAAPFAADRRRFRRCSRFSGVAGAQVVTRLRVDEAQPRSSRGRAGDDGARRARRPHESGLRGGRRDPARRPGAGDGPCTSCASWSRAPAEEGERSVDAGAAPRQGAPHPHAALALELTRGPLGPAVSRSRARASRASARRERASCGSPARRSLRPPPRRSRAAGPGTMSPAAKQLRTDV